MIKDLCADATVYISAAKEQGLNRLLSLIEEKLRENKIYVETLVSYKDTAVLADVRRYGELVKEEYREDGIYIKAYVRPQDVSRL